MPELQFKGKEFVYNHHLTVPIRPLIPDAAKSVGQPSLDGNLIIHGDNLHALQALLPMYAGKVDCIFIDPPYNTGNENWCYNDNVNSPIMREWLNSNPVNKDDMLRHDKWACLMWPRLKLLKELLAPDGVIAVTIDDNELDNLLLLMNEIFKPENRLACAAWLSDPSGGKQKSALRIGHEYIVIYGGGSQELTREEQVDVSLTLTDEYGEYAKGRELNKWGANSLRENRPSMFFALTAPDGTRVLPIRNDGREGCWRFGLESTLIRKVMQNPNEAHWEMRPFDAGITVDGQTQRWVPYEKVRDTRKIFGWSTWLDTIATNADGSALIGQIFGSKIFDTPKPLALTEWIVGLSPNQDALVLDSFAGSGTTAHAVLSLNQKDGGNRRFILVECEDYADSITAERMRRVIQGYDYQGKQKEELLRETITFTKFRQANRLMQDIQGLETMYGPSWDRIDKKIKDGVLTVTAERTVTERAEGLGGAFTYCTLGDPLDLDRLLTGETLPNYETMGAWLFHTATREPFDPSAMNEAHWYLGQSATYHVWLIYRPDLDFLKSRDAALTLTMAETISQARTDKRHLVFAPAKFISQKLLNAKNLPVDFAPLPAALFRLERSAPTATGM